MECWSDRVTECCDAQSVRAPFLSFRPKGEILFLVTAILFS